jgi:O-phospho-L-seryl-tRNASec:L-selenocysteinyl-tRNA synthase
MVPVGGAVVCSPSADTVAAIGKAYPGRASIAPTLDLFITLLSMGAEGYTGLLAEREALVPRFQQALAQCAAEHGETLLSSPRNTISLAMSLRTVSAPSKLGSMLFTRCVSGTRVVDNSSSSSGSSGSAVKEVAGLHFAGYGASVDNYPCAYLTAACAIGMREKDIEEFIARLSKALSEERRRSNTIAKPAVAADTTKVDSIDSIVASVSAVVIADHSSSVAAQHSESSDSHTDATDAQQQAQQNNDNNAA